MSTLQQASAIALAFFGALVLRRRHASFSHGDDGHVGKPHAVDPNAPFDEFGRVHHLQIGVGDVAARILSVGDVGRAERIATLLDGGGPRRTIVSSRGFVTHTGTFRGVQVSIIATGMGLAMMDFVVRECRAVVRGELAMLRLGTCGGLQGVGAGAVVVAQQGCVLIRREPDFAAHATRLEGAVGTAGGLLSPSEQLPYSVSSVVLPDDRLAALFVEKLHAAIDPVGSPGFRVISGLNASADSFYSSQGRLSPDFADHNAGLLEFLERSTPVNTLEMETYQLLSLARAARPGARIAACGAHICMWNRHLQGTLKKEDFVLLELLGGSAALCTLVAYVLEG